MKKATIQGVFGPVSIIESRKTANPYADGVVTVSTLKGTHEVWLTPSGYAVHYGMRPNLDDRLTPSPKSIDEATRLSVADLRTIAVRLANAILAHNLPGTDTGKTLTNLYPLEDNIRKELYFFRWDNLSKMVDEDEMYPFIQLALRPDGSLYSFSTTIGLTADADAPSTNPVAFVADAPAGYRCPVCLREDDECVCPDLLA